MSEDLLNSSTSVPALMTSIGRKGPPSYPLFETFLGRVLRHLNFPNATRAQIDIARYLQFGPQECIIEAFRGVGKSFVTASFVIWLLLINPDFKIMVVSA